MNEKTIQVCYLAFQYWPSVGGAQTQAQKQAYALHQLGQKALVVTLRHQRNWPARELDATVPVIRVGGWYRRDGTLRVGKFGHVLVDILLLWTLWRLRRDYDLIHTLQLSPLALVAIIIGKLTRKPVIAGVQSTGPHEQQIALPCDKRSAATSDASQGNRAKRSPFLYQDEIGGDIAALQANAWGGRWMLNVMRTSEAYYQILSTRSYIYLIEHDFRPERLLSLTNGVDIRQFYPVFWQKGAEVRVERCVLCVARLEYAKGVDVLLRAWSLMLRLSSNWRACLRPRLRLVGDGSLRGDLEHLAAELGILESVEFLGTRRDVAELLQHAWAFVLPSRWEGMSNALLEAMACALPCIASRVSGSEDVIEQGKNGLLVEPEQPQQLAYALRLLIENTDLARKLGWGGYETVLAHYQLPSIAQHCLAVYHYLLEKNACRKEDTRFIQDMQSCPEEWLYDG